MVDGRGVGGRPARVRGGVGGAGVAALGLPGVGGGDMGVVGGGRRAGERAASGEAGKAVACSALLTKCRRRFLFRVCHRDTGFLRCVASE